MRHQTKRKYADRKKLNRKYHSQKAYRKEQKRKTGWRGRWDKFTDRLANIFGIGFLILLPVVIIYGIFFGHDVYKDDIYGLWQSENHQLAISYEEGYKSGKRNWEIVQDGNMHALMRLNALMTGPSTLKFMPRNACFQASPLRMATTI